MHNIKTEPINQRVIFLILGCIVLFSIAVFQNVQITLVALFSLIACILIYVPFKEYLPVILLLVIWYIPGQTAPNGFFEDYPIFKWLSYIVIPCTVAYYFLRDFARKRHWDFSPFLLPIICIFAAICLSGINNRSNLLDFFSCLLLYLRYPLLFLLMINWDIRDSSLERIIPWFIVLSLVQLPEILCRSLILNIRGDGISFTLGCYGTLDLGIYFLYLIAFMTSHAISTRVKWYHILLLFVLLLISGFGEIKALFLFAAPVILSVILVYKRKHRKLMVRSAVLLLLVLTVLSLVFRYWDMLTAAQNYLDRITTALQCLIMGKSYSDFPVIGRLEQFHLVWNLVTSSIGQFLLGYGPGSSLVGNFSGKPGTVSAYLTWMFIGKMPMTQVAAILADLGMMGMLAFMFLFYRIAIFSLRCNKAFIDLKYKILANAFFGILVFYALLGPLYNLVWRYDSSNFLMWGLLAILYRRYSSQVRKKTA